MSVIHLVFGAFVWFVLFVATIVFFIKPKIWFKSDNKNSTMLNFVAGVLFSVLFLYSFLIGIFLNLFVR